MLSCKYLSAVVMKSAKNSSTATKDGGGHGLWPAEGTKKRFANLKRRNSQTCEQHGS